MTTKSSKESPGLLDRALRLFADVRAGEGATALILMAGIFLLMVSYYVIKTVREPWILTTGDPDAAAELKTYAAAVQAAVLIPATLGYSWLSRNVGTKKLVVGLLVFFTICIELFYFGAKAEVSFLGFVFFVWVGIFSLSVIAQFWSFANDVYDRERGERLFPIVTVGMTAGPVVGSKLGAILFDWDLPFWDVLQVSAALLVLHLLVYLWLFRRPDVDLSAGDEDEHEQKGALAAAAEGFKLIFAKPYIRLIALLLILLNLVNTTGEYILSTYVVEMANDAVASGEANDAGAFIGAFYGDFFFWVNLCGVLIQALVASRIVKYAGIGGLLFALPVVVLANYSLVAFGVAFTTFRWMKTGENAVDYSLMNNAKAQLWLPTTREEKYAAKQTTDTFFVRLGDMVSAGVVYAGTTFFEFGVRHFAMFNVAIILVWLGVAWLLTRSYKKLEGEARSDTEPA